MDNTVFFAFLLTLLAGLSTGLGSAIAFFTPKENKSVLAFALGFSAGVMIYISLAEILGEATELLSILLGDYFAPWFVLFAFAFGVLLTYFIDLFIPDLDNPHHVHKEEKELKEIKRQIKKKKSLLRLGVLTAVALALHNFPEGLATFFSALTEPTIAYSIAFAIAIHNIPEGVAVAVPIYYATNSRSKAFFYSFLSGLAEPVGAIVGFLVLKPFLNTSLFGCILAGVAGIMVYISFDELLPAAHEYGKNHLTIIGIFLGMFIMAASIAMFV